MATEKQNKEEAEASSSAIEEARVWAEAIVNTVRHPLLVLDVELRVQSANRFFYQTFQVSAEETIDRVVYELGNGQWNVPRLRNLLEEVLPRNKVVTDFEVEHTFEYLGRRTMFFNAEILSRRGGQPDLILVAIEDVTERRRAEQALRDARHYAEMIVATIREPLMVLNGDLRVRTANESFCGIFQVTPAETEGRLLYDLGDGQWNIPRLRELLENILPTKTSFNNFEVEHHFEKLGQRTMLLNARRLDDLDLILLVIEDISERKRAEETTRRLAAIVDSSADAIIGKTLEGIVTSWNAGAERIYGYSPAEMVGQPIALLASPDRLDEIPAILERVKQGQFVDSFETQRVRKDGRKIDVSVSISPIKDAAGQIIGASAIARDITEHKQMTAALRESKERISAIVNTSADAIITIDEQGIIQSVNPATERMFGYSAAEMIGRNVNMLMLSPVREEHDAYVARYLKTGEKKIIGTRREVEGRRKDGSIFPLELGVSEFRLDGKRFFAGVHCDITTRKFLQKEVLEVAAREQRRIGQELHDTTGQELTGLGLMAAGLAAGLSEQASPDAELAAKIARGVERVLEQVRNLAKWLIPVEVDAQGLMTALAELATGIGTQPGVACTFQCDEPVSVEDNTTATHLYYIAQEAVTNALKHAGAQHIQIDLATDGRRIALRIRDDGVGVADQNVAATGVGIRIMRYRAELINATLTIEAAEEGGTLVTCTLRKEDTHD
jgi:two-component system sensor kinase FixL